MKFIGVVGARKKNHLCKNPRHYFHGKGFKNESQAGGM
jgi:hypothetical protein